jgi:hypothetical protein
MRPFSKELSNSSAKKPHIHLPRAGKQPLLKCSRYYWYGGDKSQQMCAMGNLGLAQ